RRRVLCDRAAFVGQPWVHYWGVIADSARITQLANPQNKASPALIISPGEPLASRNRRAVSIPRLSFRFRRQTKPGKQKRYTLISDFICGQWPRGAVPARNPA